MSKVPGITAKHYIISEDCIDARGKEGAIDFSLEGLREEFLKLEKIWEGKNAKFHLVLTVERPE